ncbi:MAG: AEC family transporter [Bacteroidota bacterium]
MIKIVLLIVCILSGFLLKQTKWFDDRSAIILNNLIIYFFIPVLTLYHVPQIEFQTSLLWLSVTPFIVYTGSFIFIRFFAKFSPMDRDTEGALIMCSGIGSISFVGFPIFELLYGAEGLSYGIVLSLAGTFLVFNTIGIFTGLFYSGAEQNPKQLFKKIISFPPLIAFLVALTINITPLQLGEEVNWILSKLAAPFSVLALLAIGMQIDFSIDRTFLKHLMIGQFFKLVIAPCIIYLLLWHIVGLRDTVAKICLLGAAIGSMNAISILAAQMGLNPKLASLMPAIGIPLSVPILFIIDLLLKA